MYFRYLMGISSGQIIEEWSLLSPSGAFNVDFSQMATDAKNILAMNYFTLNYMNAYKTGSVQLLQCIQPEFATHAQIQDAYRNYFTNIRHSLRYGRSNSTQEKRRRKQRKTMVGHLQSQELKLKFTVEIPKSPSLYDFKFI